MSSDFRRRADRRQNTIADFITNGPEQPAAHPAFSQMCLIRNVVVVLPLVPVTAASLSRRAGLFVKCRGQDRPERARVLDHDQVARGC